MKKFSVTCSLAMTMFSVPASYFADISTSSAEPTSVITGASLSMTAHVTPFFVIGWIVIFPAPLHSGLLFPGHAAPVRRAGADQETVYSPRTMMVTAVEARTPRPSMVAR